MKRKTLPVIILAILIVGLAGPRPVKAEDVKPIPHQLEGCYSTTDIREIDGKYWAFFGYPFTPSGSYGAPYYQGNFNYWSWNIIGGDENNLAEVVLSGTFGSTSSSPFTQDTDNIAIYNTTTSFTYAELCVPGASTATSAPTVTPTVTSTPTITATGSTSTITNTPTITSTSQTAHFYVVPLVLSEADPGDKDWLLATKSDTCGSGDEERSMALDWTGTFSGYYYLRADSREDTLYLGDNGTGSIWESRFTVDSDTGYSWYYSTYNPGGALLGFTIGGAGTMNQIGIDRYSIRDNARGNLICYGTHDPNLITPTPVITPMPGPVEGILGDGGFEQWPTSTYWTQLDWTYPNIYKIAFTDPDTLDYYWGRSNTLVYIDPLQWIQKMIWEWNNGAPKCDNGMQFVGQVAPPGGITRYLSSSVGQDLTWQGGDLYWKIAARGKFYRLFSTEDQTHALAYLVDADGNKTYLLNNQLMTTGWFTYTGMVPSLPVGTYKLVLDAPDKYSDVVYYDDVQVDHSAIDTTCGVPNPDRTATPTETDTPTNDFTLSPFPHHDTDTPGPTSTNIPMPLIIYNCGFEGGSSAWSFNSASSVGLAGGPVGPQYAISQGSPPAVYQGFYLANTADVYLTAFVKGYGIIRAKNLGTNAYTTLWTGDTGTTWTQARTVTNLVSGNYWLELDPVDTSGAGAVGYDGITLATGNYSLASCALTPTPGPSPFVSATPTPSITIARSVTPSRTWLASPQPTYGTQQPTTIFNTQTPVTPTPGLSSQTSWAGTQTKDASSSQTAGPGGTGTAIAISSTAWSGTGTAWSGTGTARANGTGTAIANGTGTPIPGPVGTPCIPDQPCTWDPGGYPVDPYTDPNGDLVCPKPANSWSIAGWLDYERCTLEQFVWWGPGQQATLQAIPTLLSSKEPFNTIGQINGGIQQMQTEVATIQWGNSGMAGVNDPVSQNPNQIFKPLITGQGDPWGTGRINLGLHTSSPALTVYCSTRLTSLLSVRLAEGMCYSLNLMMAIGYLPWIQVMVNILCIWSIIRECLSLIGLGKGAQKNG